jgi:hypothetical protein
VTHPLRSFALAWLLIAMLAPSRVDAQAHQLSVSVWSDLAPGTELDSVEVTLDGTSHSRPVTSTMDFEDEAAVVYDAPVPRGAHTLSVALLLGTRRVASRSTQLRITADREIALQLDRCDGVCTAECIEGACASPASAAPSRAVLAIIEASSTRGAARAVRAFDADVSTAWCPSRPGSTLTVRFAEPVSVRALGVRPRAVAWPDGEEEPPPLPLTVTSDAGAVVTSLPVAEAEAYEVALPSAPTSTLTFQADGCLAEIQLELVDRVMVFGVPPEALASLETTITHLDRALVRSDTTALAELARFPVGFRDTAPPDWDTYEPGAPADPVVFRSAHAIPSWAAARRLEPPQPRPVPHIDPRHRTRCSARARGLRDRERVLGARVDPRTLEARIDRLRVLRVTGTARPWR